MNDELLRKLETRITFLEEKCSDLKKNIVALGIDKQVYVKCNKPIESGISCKVSYDNHGVITGSYPLNLNDIPTLDMDHIAGLRDAINTKASAVEVNKMKKEFENYKDNDKVTLTATKVNVDKYGKIVSSAELLPEDIPTLPIEKIDGLKESLGAVVVSKINIDDNDLPDVTCGDTGCKVTYDSKGRVVSKSELSIDDIPIELITRLNRIESTLTTLASIQSLRNVQTELSKKVDSNVAINPGTYCKIEVDSKGLVVKGNKLSIDDIPTLSVDKVNGLKDMMNDKADKVVINDVLVDINSLKNNMNDLNPSFLNLKIDSKADKESVLQLRNDLDHIEDVVNAINSTYDVDIVKKELVKINDILTNLNDRLVTLEVTNQK